MSIYYMNSDGLSHLSSLIYNDFKNVNNTISEVYNKANLAYDSSISAYEKANSAYDKANSAYDLASSAGDDFIYYNLPSAKFSTHHYGNGVWIPLMSANIPLSYSSYIPHSVSFTYNMSSSPPNIGTLITPVKVTVGFSLIVNIYGTNICQAQTSYIPMSRTESNIVNNVVFRFTK